MWRLLWPQSACCNQRSVSSHLTFFLWMPACLCIHLFRPTCSRKAWKYLSASPAELSGFTTMMRAASLTLIEISEEPWEVHIWTFLTMGPSSFNTISASSFSLSQSSFRLNKTFPCHGTLKVVNMCMSNSMNMDVTSFFGAWPPACPHAGSPHPDSPSRHKTLLLNEHSMQRRHTDTHGGVMRP